MQQERSEIEPIAIAEEAVMMVLLDDCRDPWTRSELQRASKRTMRRIL